MDQQLQQKRVRYPSLENDIETGGGTLLPTQDLEIIHGQLQRRCLCSLQLPDILHTLSVCNHCFSSKPAESLTQIRQETLLYISMLTLFFEVMHRQQGRGILCSRISQVVAAGADNEAAMLDILLGLMALSDSYISYSSSRALAALLLMLRPGRPTHLLLERLVDNVALSNNLLEVGHSLEVVRRVIEARDQEEHPLEDPEFDQPSECIKLSLTPADTLGTNEVKHIATSKLECQWFNLVTRLTQLLNEFTPEREYVIVSFLTLWESLISVKNNLSVTDTKEFYSGLERLMTPLTRHSYCVVWRKVLDLYNEVLCYASTLALQEVLAEEPCNLAHLIIRAVNDRRFLECVPCGEPSQQINLSSNSGDAGPSSATVHDQTVVFSGTTGQSDRTLLHKVVLLILKAIAVTVKETRSDSSSENSSRSGGSGSEDLDMAIIERSLREVIRKLDIFIKLKMPFHPEAPMAEWMVRLFSDQDDWLVESMVCGLDIFTGLGLRIRQQPELHSCVHPHTTFLVFLETVYHDHDVLLDLLVSNETSFLLYLLRYLKFIRRSWHEFAAHCARHLDTVMSVLIRLRFAIDRLVSKNLFPYNITPVLRLLQKCEEMYEEGQN